MGIKRILIEIFLVLITIISFSVNVNAASNAILNHTINLIVYGLPKGASFIWRAAPNYTTITTPITNWTTKIPIYISNTMNYNLIPWQYQGAGTTVSYNGVVYTMYTGDGGTCVSQTLNISGKNNFCAFYIYLNSSLWNSNESKELKESNLSLKNANIIVRSIINQSKTNEYNGTATAGNIIKTASDLNGSIIFSNITITKKKSYICLNLTSSLANWSFCNPGNYRLPLAVINGHFGRSNISEINITAKLNSNLYGLQTVNYTAQIKVGSQIILLEKNQSYNGFSKSYTFNYKPGEFLNISLDGGGNSNYTPDDPSVTVPANILNYTVISLNSGWSTVNSKYIQQMINLTESNAIYGSYMAYSPSLANFEYFSCSTGNIYNSWIENNQSGKLITWVNVSNTIATSNSICLGFASKSTNLLTNETGTGEAPEISPKYAEYDNGANVFTNYWNFAGNSVPNGWTSSGTVSINNGITINPANGVGTIETNSTYGPSLSNILEFYGDINKTTSRYQSAVGFIIGNAAYDMQVAWTLLDYSGAQGGSFFISTAYPQTIQTNFGTRTGLSSPTTSGTNLWQIYWPDSSASYFSYNYGSTGKITINPSSQLNIGIIGEQGTLSPEIGPIYYFRTRTYPPNGVMPAASFGNIIKPFTVSISAPSNTSLDVGQLACVTADVSGSASPFTYNFLITRTADHTANEAQNSYTNINSNSQTNCNTVQNYMVSASPLIENATVTNSTQVTRASPYSSEFNVYNAPSITISPINTTIDAGQYATFEANIPANEGVGPFTVNLVAAGNTLDTKTIPAGGGNVILSYKTDATTPNTFNVIAVDEGTSTPFTFNSISNTITINPELATPSAPILPSRPIDAGQVAATSQLPSQLGGTGTVTYYWYYSQNGIAYEPANSVQCELPSNTATASSNVECKTNIQIVPGSYFFKIYMTDSAPTPVTTASSATNSLSINSQLTPTNIISPSGPVTMDVGQSQEIHINPPTTGTPEYTYSWSNNSQCPGISSPGNVSSFSYVPNAISSGCQFKVNVTDSASVQESYTANSPLLTVNNPPILTITPSANSINVNGNIIISNSIESGTPPYSTLVLTTNAPSGGYSISGNTIYFNSIGNFSIKGTITDSANFVEANAINVRVNGTIYGKTANVIAVLSANKHSNITYKNANLSLNILPSNDVNAGIFISNITDKNIPLPSLSGANLSKIIALNITITSGASSIESENVIFGSVCQYGSGILPYSFSNGIWTEINHFTLNSSSCTISFPISPDPIVALFKETQFNSQSGGGSPPKNIQVRISDNVNSTESNQTVLTVYNSNITYSYNQDQLPVNISHVLYNSLQILFSCKFTSGKIEYTYAGMIVGLGSGYPCNSRILLYSSGNYSAIYSSAETPQTITTSVSSTSTTSASTSTISISTTALTTSATTTALPAIPPKQKVQNGYLTDAAAIVAIIIISAILIRALKRGSINKNKTKK